MTAILRKDPFDRPTFEEIVANPWFSIASDVDAQNADDYARRATAAQQSEEEEDQNVVVNGEKKI
jgi:hypothetical protein